LLEVAIEVLERRLLDLPRHVAELLPLREVAERLAAEPDELGRRDGQRLLEKRILHRAAGALAERDREVGLAHAPPPSRSSARCTARTRERRRLRPPPICMRHPASHATRHAAPVASTFSSFFSAGSCMRPGYSCLTIHAHEPDGTTTLSASRKSATVRAATARASV